MSVEEQRHIVILVPSRSVVRYYRVLLDAVPSERRTKATFGVSRLRGSLKVPVVLTISEVVHSAS